MDKFARYNPGKDCGQEITDTFGTEKYAQMFTAAKENSATKVTVTKLQDDLLNQLLHKVESADKVEGQLGLGKHRQNLAGYVNVEAFNSYKKSFNAMYSKPDSWKIPLQIFTQLKLDKIDDFFTHTKQLNYFAKLKPGKKTPSMLLVFVDKIGDEKMAKMLAAVTMNPKTNKFATDMQRAQLGQLLVSKESVLPTTAFG
ncbi:LOW QUALITY PROTEIN: hypothetical protein PHMEG_00035363 [Phytophthora megakarya]|uniref:RxLR effector protein n=1 Tax=Phytophthora megakarya TaxID=4795 RepID=A0A225UNW7_9STRA|nr:LOW QUALITY PROTEIN: hypothetical protein PHMEG_00035363 [Phytophthora megakarya]